MTRLDDRLTHYFVLLDCAFLFYKGLPLRIVSSEVECDLPCAEDIFDAAHPFTHPHFQFKRVTSTRTAFQAVFDARKDDPRLKELNVIDTFILIHCELNLFLQINWHLLTTIAVLYRYTSDALTIQLCRQGSDMRSGIYEDITAALNHWHHHWSRLKRKATEDAIWDRLGFFKNGDQYEAAIRLLLSEKARPHLRDLLRGRVDRLDRLKQIVHL